MAGDKSRNNDALPMTANEFMVDPKLMARRIRLITPKLVSGLEPAILEAAAKMLERGTVSETERRSEPPSLNILGLPMRLHAPSKMLRFSDHITIHADDSVPEGTVELRDTIGRVVGRIINVW